MIDEQFEFRISQLADGTLPSAEADALRAALINNAEARELFATYERLQHGVSALPAIPPIDWNHFAATISAAIDANEVATPASFPMPWLRRATGIAVAACVAIAVGVGMRWSTSGSKFQHDVAPVGQIVVAGPAIDSPTGQIVQQITIGPSAAVANAGDTAQYGDSGVVVRSQRVVIASGVDAVQDTNQDSAPTPY